LATQSVNTMSVATDLSLTGGRAIKAALKLANLEISTELPPRLEIPLPGLELSLPPGHLTTEIDPATGGYRIIIKSAGTPVPASPSSAKLSPFETSGKHELETPSAAENDIARGSGDSSTDGDLPEGLQMLVNVLLVSVGVMMKRGRFMLTSDGIEVDVALHRDLMGPLFDRSSMPNIEEQAAEAVLKPYTDPQSLYMTTTQSDLDQAILQFIAPIIFEDSHGLRLTLAGLQLKASTPEGHPSDLNLSLHANSPGRVVVQLDVAKILTDVLDLVEIQDRLIGQGIF